MSSPEFGKVPPLLIVAPEGKYTPLDYTEREIREHDGLHIFQAFSYPTFKMIDPVSSRYKVDNVQEQAAELIRRSRTIVWRDFNLNRVSARAGYVFPGKPEIMVFARDLNPMLLPKKVDITLQLRREEDLDIVAEFGYQRGRLFRVLIGDGYLHNNGPLVEMRLGDKLKMFQYTDRKDYHSSYPEWEISDADWGVEYSYRDFFYRIKEVRNDGIYLFIENTSGNITEITVPNTIAPDLATAFVARDSFGWVQEDFPASFSIK